MKTLTAEEFKKQYGESEYDKFNAPQKSSGYLSRVGSEIGKTFSGLKSDIGTQNKVITSQTNESPLITGVKKTVAAARTGLRTAGAVAKTAFTPVMEAPGIKQGTEFIGEKIAETTPMKKFQEWAQRHPEAAKDIENTLDIASLIPIGGGTKVAATGVERTATKIGESAANFATKTAEKIAPKVTSVGEYTAGRIPKLLGIFSGESDDVVKKALVNPKVAQLGIEQGDEALRTAVREGAENSVKIKNTFVRAYAEAKNKTLGGYTKVVVPKNNVKGVFNDLLERNGVKVTREGLDFSTSKIAANPGEIGKIKTAWEGLDKWGKFTLGSIDDYKQFVGKLRSFATDAGVPSKSPFLGELYNELNKIITTDKKIPLSIRQKYATLNKNFSSQIELYDDIVDAFNSGDPFTKLANALGKNKDTLRNTLEFYEKKSGKSVLPLVAGRELAMEKTAAFGFLNPRSWIDLLVSPKVQAKLVTKAGESLQRVAPKVAEKIVK